jgi:hypothetical protein
MSDTPITSTEGQAMVNTVVASIRAEHAGFPAYRFKKTVGSKHFYEAPSSKACLLSKDGPHSKKKVSYFTVSIGDRSHATLCCWSQKCAPQRYPVPATMVAPKPKIEPFFVYQSDVVLQTYAVDAGLDIVESSCCSDTFLKMTGPNAYSVADLIAFSTAATEPCCEHFHGHVAAVIAELERQATLCLCCNKDPGECPYKMFTQATGTVKWDSVLRMPVE